MNNLVSILKSRDITLPTKVRLVKAMVFPVVMYGCDSWTIKKAECRRIHAFELWCWRRLLSPLDCKEIQPVHPKGDQSWVFIGMTDVEAETPILWPADAKSWLIWKNPDAGKDWEQEEKATTEDEMVGWYHRLNGHGFGWTPRTGDAQGGLTCSGSQGCKELDTTEWLNWNEQVFADWWSSVLKKIFPEAFGCMSDSLRGDLRTRPLMQPLEYCTDTVKHYCVKVLWPIYL